VNFALVTGAQGITISPGIIHEDGDVHSLARAIPCLQYMSDLAQLRGIRLSFEPHLDSIAPTPEKADLVMAAVPNLRLTLDIAHWIAQGYGWREIKPMLAKSAHIQIRQARPQRLQTPFKKGKLDIPRLIRDLTAIDYDGTLAIEYMNAVGWHGMMKVDVTQEISQTRAAIRQAREGLLDIQDDEE
jgi:sugar phosphate isomerase/epimerase